MKELRVGLIGTGAIGREHIKRLCEKVHGVRLVAVTDKFPESARAAAAPYGVRVEPDEQALLSAADIDAVVVTSSSAAHEAAVLGAVARGKPAFCEKPLADTAAGCLRIVEAEQKAGKRLVQVGFMRRYDKGYREMKAILESGRLGAPLIVHCAHRLPAMDDEGFTAAMQVTDGIIHEIDILHWLVDDVYTTVQVSYPRRARASRGVQADPQVAVIRTARGLYLEVESFFNCGFAYDIQCEVVCDEGTVRLPDPPAAPVRHAGRREAALEMSWMGRFLDAYDTELQDWADALLTDGVPRGPSAWDGYVAAVTADACIRSQQSGREEPVGLPVQPAFYR